MYKIIAGNFSVKFISAVINLLIAILISQYLGASGKGEQSLIIVTISFIILFNNFVGGASVVYLTPRNPLNHIVVPSYIWSFIINIIAAIALYVWSGLSLFLVGSITMLSFISSLTAVNTSILIGQMKIAKHNFVVVLIPILTLGVLFVSVLNESVTITHYVYALYLAYGVSFIMSVFYLFRANREKSEPLTISEFFSALKQLLFFGTQNQLMHIFHLLNLRLSYYVLEHNSGQAAVGVYSNGISIVESVWMITGSICIYQYSAIANNLDKEHSFRLTESLTKLGLFLSLLAIIVLAFIPSSVYQWIFGQEFAEVSEVILIMLPGIWFFNYAKILGHFFSGIGKYHIAAIASAIGFCLTVILLFFVFEELTIYKAAITATLTYILTSLIIVAFYIREGGKLVVFFSLKEVKGFYEKYIGN